MGRVLSSSVAENSMENDEVGSCILREVDRMRFDEPLGSPVDVSYPFEFTPDADER